MFSILIFYWSIVDLYNVNFCFWIVVVEKLLRVPWTARRLNQSILKEINHEYSLEGLRPKLQYFVHLMQRADLLEKTLILGKTEGKRRRGETEDEMVGWHHQLNGHEFEQALGVGDGQGSLVCCGSWGCKESDRTEWLNWRRLLRVHWTERRSNQSILKEINPEYSLEGLMLKLISNILATWCQELTRWKRPWCWERLKAGGEGTTKDEMVRWHHWLNGHEFEQTLGDNKVQGRLACCSSWVAKSRTWLSNWATTTIIMMFSSVTQSCPTLCDPMNRSTPGFPVPHYLLGFAQSHMHGVNDAIQPSHLPPPPSPLVLNLF